MIQTRVRAGALSGLILPLALASVITVVHFADLLAAPAAAEPGSARSVTLRVPVAPIADREASGLVADTPRFTWRDREWVVPRGTALSGDRARLAAAFENGRRPLNWRPLVGWWLAAFVASWALFAQLRRSPNQLSRLLNTHVAIAVSFATLTAVGKAVLTFTPWSPWWVSMITVALWAALYLDRRDAFALHAFGALCVLYAGRLDLAAAAIVLLRGSATLALFRDRKHPTAMLAAALAGGVIAGAAMLLAQFYFGGRWNLGAAMGSINAPVLASLTGETLAAGIALALHAPISRAFGAITRSRMVDLADLEQPLLQKMAKEAPGSWQHARAMANLAEAAAVAIGADSMLTRLGAYYHDLGKTIQPQYFIENLGAGETSPHDELEPEVSADAIMAHVVGGTQILRAGGIPESVVEFAFTHHGTSVIEFFWGRCQEQGNPRGLTEEAFRYPGMKPQSRETAILMLIDAIEAASRTIDPPEKTRFEEMIGRVALGKLRQGQLDESGLSLEDLRVLTTTVAEALVSVYHHRIKYPWQK